MGCLTTHVLNTSEGIPAAGITIDLIALGDERQHIKSVITNDDGRVDSPLLADAEFKTGQYELIFLVGDYFKVRRLTSAEPAFLEEVVVRFGIADENDHYHVPLLVSPWSFSSYRGS